MCVCVCASECVRARARVCCYKLIIPTLLCVIPVAYYIDCTDDFDFGASVVPARDYRTKHP